MDTEKLIERARSAMADQRSHADREQGYAFHHGLRTARLALALKTRLPEAGDVCEETLFAGALFHDVGKAVNPHHETGAVLVGHLLADLLPAEPLDAVARIVREHNQRHRPAECGLASRIVQDADLLDHFGAQGIWLTLHYSAANGRDVEATVDYRMNARWLARLGEHRGLLNFAVSLEEFDRRTGIEEAYFRRLAAEQEGELG